MKLKHKILSILTLCAIPIAPITTITSCGGSSFEELNLTEQIQYIESRTFSLMATNNNNSSYGTGWIISDCTKNDTTDYQYWIATNWHVTKLLSATSLGNQYYYSDKSMAVDNKYLKRESYTPFLTFKIEEYEKFTYSGAITTYWSPAIDLSVVKVNFGNPTGTIKTKLDKINEFQKQNGYINKFVKDSDEIRKKDKITAGYPLRKSGNTAIGCEWEGHSFKGSLLDYCSKATKYDGLNCGHSIGNPNINQDGSPREGGTESFYYWDISPQYKFHGNAGKSFMSGGASGSMLLTKDYEICGIYWGGWESGSNYYPSFSLFNTDDMNFLAQYINN